MNAMLNGKDPKTGENLTEDSIINNMITFMIAGMSHIHNPRIFKADTARP
jgi:cytochrome P450